MNAEDWEDMFDGRMALAYLSIGNPTAIIDAVAGLVTSSLVAVVLRALMQHAGANRSRLLQPSIDAAMDRLHDLVLAEQAREAHTAATAA